MRRFQQWIGEARGTLPAWANRAKECIPVVAARCEAADIVDLLDALDELAKERAGLPEWDGDSHDDIGQAQELFARILAALPDGLLTNVMNSLEKRDQETRAWVRLALSERAGSAPPDS